MEIEWKVNINIKTNAYFQLVVLPVATCNQTRFDIPSHFKVKFTSGSRAAFTFTIMVIEFETILICHC